MYQFRTNFCLLLTHLLRYDRRRQPMATTTTPRTTAMSDCSRGGNGCHSKMVSRRQRCHQAKWNDNATTRRREMTGSRNDRGAWGKRLQRRGSKGKKAQAMSFDVSWAIGKFLLFSFHVFLLLNFFRYLLELLMTKVTQHPPPLLRAAARGVVTGATPKQRDDGHAAIRPN